MRTKRVSKAFVASLSTAFTLILLSAHTANAQTGTSVDRGDWPVYHGGEFSQRYSPLDQINAENVGSLEIAWRFATPNFGPSTDFNNPSTPFSPNVGSSNPVLASSETS